MTDEAIAARNETMLRQRRGGASVATIARAHGLSGGYTSRLSRHLNDDCRPPDDIVKLPLNKAAIAAAYLRGASTNTLARALGVSYSTVYRVLAELGVPMQLDTTVVPAARCANAFQSAGEFCTDNPHGTDGPGNGDSGGPAVQLVDGVPQLVGTCSRGASAGAGRGHLGVHERAGLPAVDLRRRPRWLAQPHGS
ncbi:helix-turn-helix domain-containing protein [Amycolatopsis sp., V23-08]|uniref:Helix-turn-helix domain-containing protein n=1 Tax=Amycolatopsis heterodermiae TaxID=3110235 RepID=A0ABU5RJI3_9PSEU|nr:helix-turn-helix domain-containing protein [Amycolatopsis sp., V23-08]MEA5366448.1 helix-turn-helix domain-containing protein [Amycolatopsis sp., V23-08]